MILDWRTVLGDNVHQLNEHNLEYLCEELEKRGHEKRELEISHRLAWQYALEYERDMSPLIDDEPTPERGHVTGSRAEYRNAARPLKERDLVHVRGNRVRHGQESKEREDSVGLIWRITCEDQHAVSSVGDDETTPASPNAGSENVPSEEAHVVSSTEPTSYIQVPSNQGQAPLLDGKGPWTLCQRLSDIQKRPTDTRGMSALSQAIDERTREPGEIHLVPRSKNINAY